MNVEYQVVFNRKKTLNKKGKAVVQIQAYQGGNRKYFSTDVYLCPEEYKENPKNQRYTKDHDLNNKILSKINQLREFETDFRLVHKTFKLSDFRYFIENIDFRKPETFTQFVKQELENQKLKLEYVTWKQQDTCIKLFHKAIGDEISFSQLNYGTIVKFDAALRKSGIGENTIRKRHVQLKKYINEAIRNKFLKMDDNPYLSFKLKGVKSNRTSLTPQEVALIEGLEIDPIAEPKLAMYRDMFLFAVFTGLRISDVLKITQEELKETKDGLVLFTTLFKNRKKNPIQAKVPLSLLYNAKPEVIIRRYYRTDARRIFYGSTGPKVNKAIKEIVKRCGINKHVTFHVSRHTFCTETSRVMPTAQVQQLAYHSSIQTTQQYLHGNSDAMNETLKETKWKL